MGRLVLAALAAAAALLLAAEEAQALPAGVRSRAAKRLASRAVAAAAGGPGPAARTFPQRLDHFDAKETRTWPQRYFVNATFFGGEGHPVFLCVGGEGPAFAPSVVVTGDAHCALMIALAQEHGALVLALEHRFYGASVPTPDLTEESLQYHSSRQGLADLAHFHSFATEEFQLAPGTRWVSFGGSYPGMMAGWFRLQYPHLVHAAVASAAPTRAQMNFQGYNDVVASAVAAPEVGGSDACADAVTRAFEAVGAELQDPAGRVALAMQFRVCGGAESLKSVDNQAQLTEDLGMLFPAQSNDPACTDPGCNIERACEVMLDKKLGLPVGRLGHLAKLGFGEECLDVDYAAEVNELSDTTVKGLVDGDRSWMWQVCNEFGFFQTCDPSSSCIFTTKPWLNTLESQVALCETLFGISASEVELAVNTTNERTGADKPAGTRVMFPNGSVDPWSASGVLVSPDPANEPTLWVVGASHHAWTHPPRPTDQQTVQEARLAIGKQVAAWLAEPARSGSPRRSLSRA